VFESLRPDHLFFKKSSHLAVTGFFYDLLFLRGADFCPTFCPTEDFDYPLVEREGINVECSNAGVQEHRVRGVHDCIVNREERFPLRV